jgi:hypothetical protein
MIAVLPETTPACSLVKVLPRMTTSIVTPSGETASMMSPRAPRKLLPVTVSFMTVPAPEPSKWTASLPVVGSWKRTVVPETVRRSSVPDVLRTRTLSRLPPSMSEFVMAALPRRLSKLTLPSCAAPALVPLTPWT